jgi:DNA invertase Pin-like site-specific DNA recombinase
VIGLDARGCQTAAASSLLADIAAARSAAVWASPRPVYKGRPPSIEASRVRELKDQGMRPSDIAKALKIGRASVYRVLAAAGGC